MPTAESKRRWFHLPPDRFVIGLLLGICLLWLSERFQWFGFNHHKGWTVLIAVAAVGVAAFVVLLWWIASLIVGWRFQFGVRSLLVFCVAFSIAAGWFAVEMRRAERQREVVKSITALGGSVGYDWESIADGDPIVNPEPPGPEWLRRMLGNDFFSGVVTINASKTEITDAGLDQFKELPSLKQLVLNGTNVTDAGLGSLKGMRLTYLGLAEAQISDVGLEKLTGLPQVECLDLSRTGITDAGLQYIIGMAHLSYVNLHLTNVTDDGLEQLKGMSQLTQLNLNNTGITDAGLKHLEGWKQLEYLDLRLSRATKAGVKKLKQALPSCNIIN